MKIAFASIKRAKIRKIKKNLNNKIDKRNVESWTFENSCSDIYEIFHSAILFYAIFTVSLKNIPEHVTR